MSADRQPFRDIPSVNDFILSAPGRELCARFGAGMVKLFLREVLDETRGRIGRGETTVAPDGAEIAAVTAERIARVADPDGRRAVNATGILLHTGLGRAPLCAAALKAVAAFGGYSLLQTDLETGQRSLRTEKIEKMICELTGAEACTVVNNNAAATMLVLNTLADGREAIVSRGQLIEIGGSFRLPDVMRKSGALLREVGTTNKTHPGDYENAIGDSTGAIVHVHTSNYRIRGFSSTPDVRELARIGKKRGVPVIDDLGSGALVSLAEFGLSDEPLVRDSVAAGADVMCFSGDKLISGAQAGIVCGKKEWIARIRKNPFARMLRVCKLTLAVLEATLVHFVNGTYRGEIPFYRMLGRDTDTLRGLADTIVGGLGDRVRAAVEIDADLSYVGSGSIPDEALKSLVLRVDPVAFGSTVGRCARRLRGGVPSIIPRVHDDKLVFDMRTIFEDETEAVVRGLNGLPDT